MSKHRKDTCLEHITETPSNINNYATLNNEHNWKDLCIQLTKKRNVYMY